jgi:glycosyltransferase involved in cell wall biosynthesis
MIVKNEAGVIRDTLDRVSDKIHSWVICDTGSTDNTCETVRRYFAEKGIPGELFQDTWENFAHNRTLAFQRACSRADRADYVWVLDADDLLTGTLLFPSEMTADAYSLQYGDDTCMRFQRPQLFSTRLEWVYRGVVHEFPYRADSLPYTVYFIPGDYFMDYMHSRRNLTNDRGKNPLKYLRDAQLMEKALKSETDVDTYWRYVYYIGQSYFDYGDYEKALEYFRWHLETVRNHDTYFCHFYSAEALKITDKEKNEADIIAHYLKGIVLDPTKAECPFSLAKWYFESTQYEKTRSTLAQFRNLALPTTHHPVLPSLYQFSTKWLLIQTCHLLERDTEEKEIWQQLFIDYPDVVEKCDIRNYPLAVEYLFSTPVAKAGAEARAKAGAEESSNSDQKVVLVSTSNDVVFKTLTDPSSLVIVSKEEDASAFRYRLFVPFLTTETCGWLFVRPWSLSAIVSAMTTRKVSRMYLSRGETLFENGSTITDTNTTNICYVEDTQAPVHQEDWWNESLCTRFPLASYESVAYPEHSEHSVTTTVSLGVKGITYHDLLTAFFLFALCREAGFRFRFSTKVYRSAVHFVGTWKTKEELVQVLRTQPLFQTGDFFRVDWLPSNFREVVWPRFKEFMGAHHQVVPVQRLDSSFQPQHFSEVLGVETFAVEKEQTTHPLWPLVAHLVVLFDVGFSTKTPTSLLDFSSVASETKFACFRWPVSLQMHPDRVTNEILLYSSTVSSTSGKENEWQLRLDEDYTLSVPFLAWQVRFMDLVWHLRQWKHSWRTIHLLEDLADLVDRDAPVLSPSLQDSSPFSLQNNGCTEQEAPSYHYPLLKPWVETCETSEKMRFIHFPTLHFVDSEVYYSANQRPSPHGYDAYNDLGFYKTWVPGRTQHFEEDVGNGYPGDWVAFFMQQEWSKVSLPPREVPRVPKSMMPVYGVQWEGEGIKKYPSLPVLPLDTAPDPVHVYLWVALSQDPCHEHYVVLEKEALFHVGRPYFEDVQASLTIVLKLLREKPSWDILVLGNPGQPCNTSLSLETYTPQGGEKVLGYVMHKKTACFLSGVVREMGMPETKEELWKYCCTEQPFLKMFRLSSPLVHQN